MAGVSALDMEEKASHPQWPLEVSRHSHSTSALTSHLACTLSLLYRVTLGRSLDRWCHMLQSFVVKHQHLSQLVLTSFSTTYPEGQLAWAASGERQRGAVGNTTPKAGVCCLTLS